MVYVAIGLNLCILLEDLIQKDEKEHFVPKEIVIPRGYAMNETWQNTVRNIPLFWENI